MTDVIEGNELVEVAMQIILHAGDARIKLEEALKYLKEMDFTKAKEVLIEAEECIRLAHLSQTKVIQDETRGRSYDSSLLFNHAQDTLMTVMSEGKITKQMIEVFEVFYQACKK
ncbi:MAG: PTS lactose/cellobiose transporter subunit IIA [Breznakia sp.]